MLGRLSSQFKPITNRYDELNDDQRYDFRVTVRNFDKWYNYIAQLDRTFDMDMLEENIFVNYFLKFIPREQRERVELKDKIKLEYYKLREDFAGDIHLIAEDPAAGLLTHPKEINATVKPPNERDSLEEIIHRVNERFPDDFNDKDRVLLESLYRSFVENPDQKLVTMAKTNDAEMFEKSLFPEFFQDKIMDEYTNNQQSYEKLFGSDDKYYKFVYTLVAKYLYKTLRSKL